MKTIIELELDPAKLQALYTLLGGTGKGTATRPQIKEWAVDVLVKKITKPAGEKTELRNFMCPKCQKPIAIDVPMVGLSTKRDAKLAAAAGKSQAAIDELVRALATLKEALPT